LPPSTIKMLSANNSTSFSSKISSPPINKIENEHEKVYI
jgi:hypothetical protein